MAMTAYRRDEAGMTETHDLVGRLLAAIGQRETAALAASPGPWAPNAEHDEIVAVDGITVADGFALSNNQLRATVDFIVDNDPTAVLRRCAADRKIVELHSPEQAGDVGPPRCRTCHGESWILDEGEDSGGTVYQEAQWRGEPHPCATLLAVAERYDLAEQRRDQP